MMSNNDDVDDGAASEASDEAWRPRTMTTTTRKRPRGGTTTPAKRPHASGDFYRSTDPAVLAWRAEQLRAAEARRRERALGAWREFGRQAEAFAYVDQKKEDEDHEELPARLWAREVDSDGRRRYVVASYERFVDEYSKLPSERRHFYELVREAAPVRPYFDLEFNTQANPGVNGASLTDAWLRVFVDALRERFFLRGGDDDEKNPVLEFRVALLDATTPTKFSRHAILSLPGGDLFEDAYALGAFATSVLDAHRDRFEVNKPDGTRTSIVDTTVYSKNRLFRLCGSSKMTRSSYPFVFVDASSASSSSSESREVVVVVEKTFSPPLPPETLVVPLETEPRGRLLRFFEMSGAAKGQKASAPRRGVSGVSFVDDDDVNRCRGRRRGQTDVAVVTPPGASHPWGARLRGVVAEGPPPSPFPKLDSFVLALRPGARIRKWERLRARGGGGDGTMDDAQSRRSGREGRLVLHLVDNRYCEHIRRPHKSNNIYFVADLGGENHVMQRCHDRESCAHFSGFPVPFPDEVRDHVFDVLACEALDDHLVTTLPPSSSSSSSS